jgi:two-component system, cell cycle sensor histidine kinase and response regulator CckA
MRRLCRRLFTKVTVVLGDTVVIRRTRQNVILVIDDETSVRRICRLVLEKAGHCVLEASDGVKALDLLRTYSGPIDLIVCDVVMPNMSGIEFVEQLKREQPEMKVLLISGQVESSPIEGLEMIRKPFSAQMLASAVQTLLPHRELVN